MCERWRRARGFRGGRQSGDGSRGFDIRGARTMRLLGVKRRWRGSDRRAVERWLGGGAWVGGSSYLFINERIYQLDAD